jgi:endoglucanase Acf2
MGVQSTNESSLTGDENQVRTHPFPSTSYFHYSNTTQALLPYKTALPSRLNPSLLPSKVKDQHQEPPRNSNSNSPRETTSFLNAESLDKAKSSQGTRPYDRWLLEDAKSAPWNHLLQSRLPMGRGAFDKSQVFVFEGGEDEERWSVDVESGSLFE